MSAPLIPAEVGPISTKDRIALELRPRVVAETSAVEYEWVRVRQVGQRLTAIVSALSYLEMHEVRKIVDVVEQSLEILKRARAEVMHAAEPLAEGCSAIPEAYVYSLVGKVIAISSTGVDPFVEAPAGSLL